MSQHAIITADIVGSTKLSETSRLALEKTLWVILEDLVEDKSHFLITRGDNFQLLILNPVDALKVAIKIRCLIKSKFEISANNLADARISIGIGSIGTKGKTIGSSDGEAYRLSGRGLDKIEQDKIRRLIIQTGNEELNSHFEIVGWLVDDIISSWNAIHAETVLKRIEGKTYKEIGDEFDISHGAVRDRLLVAKWDLVEKVLNYFQGIVSNKIK